MRRADNKNGKRQRVRMEEKETERENERQGDTVGEIEREEAYGKDGRRLKGP